MTTATYTFNKRAKLLLCAAKDTGRYAMEGVAVGPDPRESGASAAVATDGRRLVVVPLEGAPGDEMAMVPPAIWKAAARGRAAIPGALAVEGKMVTACPAPGEPEVTAESEGGVMPDYAAVLPDGTGPQGTTPVELRLNAKYLADMAAAMGSADGTVSLHLDVQPDGGVKTAIVVRPLDGEHAGHGSQRNAKLPGTGAVGVLMPVTRR